MANGTTNSNFPTAPTVLAEVLTSVEQASAFQRFSRQVPLSAEGIVINSVGISDPAWVAETGVKPVVATPHSQIEMVGKKLAKIVYMSEEFADDQPTVAAKIFGEAAPSLSRGFDRTIGGFISAPLGFDTLVASANAVITDVDSFIDATVKDEDQQIVLNGALLAALLKVKDVDTKERLTITDTTINGVPYIKLANFGTTPLGYVGPFDSKTIWGVIPGSVKIKKSTEATIDDNGTLVNLWQTNQIAYLVEGRFGFRVLDASLFSKIVTTTV